MNLSELQNYVWSQTDTTPAELKATDIENWLDEAFIRTTAASNRWPWYETQWQMTIPEGDRHVDLAPEVNIPGLLSVTITYDAYQYQLRQIGQEEAEARFPYRGESAQGSDDPTAWVFHYYSPWGRRLYFWPAHTAKAGYDVVLRGHRIPQTTFDAGTGEVDADPRLHRALGHYACALAYAQQEDAQLEQSYMTRWQRDVEMVHEALLDPARARPAVMHGNWPRSPIGGYTSGRASGHTVGPVSFNVPSS